MEEVHAMTVHYYVLNRIDGIQMLMVPGGGEPLCVMVINGELRIYFRVDPDLPTVGIRVHTSGTGRMAPPPYAKYLGSCVDDKHKALDDPTKYLVWHVFLS